MKKYIFYKLTSELIVEFITRQLSHYTLLSHFAPRYANTIEHLPLLLIWKSVHQKLKPFNTNICVLTSPEKTKLGRYYCKKINVLLKNPIHKCFALLCQNLPCLNTEKYGQEKTPYLDTSHAVITIGNNLRVLSKFSSIK